MPQYIVKLKTEESLKRCCLTLRQKKIKFAPLKSINSIVYKAKDIGEAIELLEHEHPLRLDEDILVSLWNHTPFLPAEAKGTLLPWNMKRIGATRSRIPKKFSRPRVAIFSTGVSPHPHLPPPGPGINLSNEPGMADHHGLGTHTAGIICAYSPQKGKLKFHGIFPRLPLGHVKVFNKGGITSISRLIRGLEWCMQKNVNLAVFPFTLLQHHPAFYEAVKAAHRQGIIMVAPCGDDGSLGVNYPARYREVLAVGSTNEEDRISSFSQAGTDLDLVAPGEAILSTGKSGRWAMGSGSALACAHVAGCLALALSLNPELTLGEIRSLLQRSCEPLPASPLLQGYGLLSLNGLLSHLLSGQI